MTTRKSTSKTESKAAQPKAQAQAQAQAVEEKASQGGDAKDAAKDSRAPGEIPALFVRTRKRVGSRRRAGFRFTREGHGIARSALSDEQLDQLHADPALEVEECTFPADDDGEAEQ